MPSDKTLLPHFVCFALALWLFAGCATTKPSGPGLEPADSAAELEDTASSVTPAIETSPIAPSEVAKPVEPPATAAVIDLLSRQLRIPSESIEILQAVRAEWPDMCLGLPAEGEICGSMITQGYAVGAMAAGQRYEFRTDELGERIRLASAPVVDPGRPLLTWRDSRSFSILIVGTERVAFGRRGRPMLVAPLGVPERAQELEHMLARFAVFQGRTPAGEVALTGVGSNRPTAAEQRMLAEWARLVFVEAEKGLSDRAPDRAIAWQRDDKNSGFCNEVVIGRSGIATARACKGGDEQETARVQLAASDMDQLYKWMDKLESFSQAADDPGLAEGVAITIAFSGDGFDPVTEKDRDAIQAFVNRIVARLFAASPQSK